MSLEALYWCGSIFLWSLFTGLGVPPLPEEAGILYAASVATLHPKVHWWMAWPAASLGIMAADIVLYGIGRFWGHKVLRNRWLVKILPPERRKRMEMQFHRHGMKFLLVARLLPPLRTGVFIIAGTIHFSLPLFLIADTVYGIVGVGLVFFGGSALVALLHQVGDWVLVAVVIVAASGGVYFFLHRKETKVSPAQPDGGRLSDQAKWRACR